jgi:uncharacterized membrane protein
MTVGAAVIAAPASVIGRREYLDWLRGLAVLIMIEAHVIDSWTRLPDRTTPRFFDSMILGGFGAPLFLFLAGMAVALSAGAKLQTSGDARAASRAVMRRGVEILGLAFLFRLQAWALGWSPPWYLFKVDILNIMGPSIVAAAALWGMVDTTARRVVILATATIVLGFVTPLVRNVAGLSALPDPIEAYITPVRGLTNFTFFPWTGLLFAGTLAGVILERTRDVARERWTAIAFLLVGLGIAVLAHVLSFRPMLVPGSRFWTTSPAFFFLRVGIMVAAIGCAYAWESRPGARRKWSPVKQLGRTSLFIYWIHVEMVYGVISIPLRRNLSLTGAWIALGLFCLFMLWCSIMKDRIAGRGSRVVDRSRRPEAGSRKPEARA